MREETATWGVFERSRTAARSRGLSYLSTAPGPGAAGACVGQGEGDEPRAPERATADTKKPIAATSSNSSSRKKRGTPGTCPSCCSKTSVNTESATLAASARPHGCATAAHPSDQNSRNAKDDEDADRHGHAHDDQHGEDAPGERHLDIDEELSRDDLGAEQDPIEIDLADVQSDEAGDDDEIERGHAPGLAGVPHELASEQQRRAGVQQHLEPLDDAVLHREPAGESRLDERDHGQHSHGDQRQPGGDGLRAYASDYRSHPWSQSARSDLTVPRRAGDLAPARADSLELAA